MSNLLSLSFLLRTTNASRQVLFGLPCFMGGLHMFNDEIQKYPKMVGGPPPAYFGQGQYGVSAYFSKEWIKERGVVSAGTGGVNLPRRRPSKDVEMVNDMTPIIGVSGLKSCHAHHAHHAHHALSEAGWRSLAERIGSMSF